MRTARLSCLCLCVQKGSCPFSLPPSCHLCSDKGSRAFTSTRICIVKMAQDQVRPVLRPLQLSTNARTRDSPTSALSSTRLSTGALSKWRIEDTARVAAMNRWLTLSKRLSELRVSATEARRQYYSQLGDLEMYRRSCDTRQIEYDRVLVAKMLAALARHRAEIIRVQPLIDDLLAERGDPVSPKPSVTGYTEEEVHFFAFLLRPVLEAAEKGDSAPYVVPPPKVKRLSTQIPVATPRSPHPTLYLRGKHDRALYRLKHGSVRSPLKPLSHGAPPVAYRQP